VARQAQLRERQKLLFRVASRKAVAVILDSDEDALYILSSAVGNLLQNAFNFTRDSSEVTLNAYAFAQSSVHAWKRRRVAARRGRRCEYTA
jgi:signal transduction histidine kinase